MSGEPKSSGPYLLYGLNDRPPAGRTALYAVQWLFFALANSAVVPVVVGGALGLDQAGVAALVQRTFFFQGVASFLQVTAGHRLPIIEGPSGMWWGIFITLAALAPGLGKPLSALRTDLELGVMAAGATVLLTGMCGFVGRARRLFTPPVTGSVLVLLGIQLSGTFVKGMLGLGSGGLVDGRACLVSLAAITAVVLVSLKARGFGKSLAVLAGIAAGWLAAVPAGLAGGGAGRETARFIVLPELFAFGPPTFDGGVVLACVLTGLLVLSNLVASIMAMEKALGIELPPKTYDRGVSLTGVADILAGAGATVGFVPYSAGAAMVGITGVASRLPFALFALALAVLGLLPAVAAILASIPEPAGYSVLLASFCQMVAFGLKDYARTALDERDSFVIGLTLLFGTGVMFLPPAVLAGLPSLVRYILGNGFLCGMLVCLLLEHILLPKKFFGQKN